MSLTFPPSGPWTGFYLENHHDKRGWMHLFLQFERSSSEGVPASLRGEGTDYVGPWLLEGGYRPETGLVQWTKSYVGKHRVRYAGKHSETGIVGSWSIGAALSGRFHIWPAEMTELQERYLQEDLRGSSGPTPGF